jgi:hypothetical protein
VFRCCPFLCGLMMSIAFVMMPYLYPVFNTLFECAELLSLLETQDILSFSVALQWLLLQVIVR